jgi:hypothetical protein
LPALIDEGGDLVMLADPDYLFVEPMLALLGRGSNPSRCLPAVTPRRSTWTPSIACCRKAKAAHLF